MDEQLDVEGGLGMEGCAGELWWCLTSTSKSPAATAHFTELVCTLGRLPVCRPAFLPACLQTPKTSFANSSPFDAMLDAGIFPSTGWQEERCG